MYYPIDFAIIVTLAGDPTHVTASWVAPDGTRRTIVEPLDVGVEMAEAEHMIRFIAEAITADPF
jgi:hypothetical protein